MLNGCKYVVDINTLSKPVNGNGIVKAYEGCYPVATKMGYNQRNKIFFGHAKGKYPEGHALLTAIINGYQIDTSNCQKCKDEEQSNTR